MRSLLALTFLLIATGLVLATNVNPFDSITQPFAIGGSFKRTEQKSVATGFTCWNASTSEWADFELAELNGLSTLQKVQLKNGAVIALFSQGSTHRFFYWDLNTTTLLGGKESLIISASLTIRLSVDEKKLIAYGPVMTIGATDLTKVNNVLYRVIAFDIATLPAATLTYVDYTSGYPSASTTMDQSIVGVYPLTSGNVLVGFPDASFIHYVVSTNTWSNVSIPTTARITYSASTDLKYSPITGDLFGYGFLPQNTPLQTVFYKFNTASLVFDATVTLTLATNDVATSTALSKWTVGDNTIYYTITSTGLPDAVFNVQQVTLGTATPVSLGTTRLVTGVTRGALDNQTLDSAVTTLYYDASIAQLVLVLTSDVAYQVYGTRDFFSTIYAVNYRVQPMGMIVAFNTTSKTYGVPYGGAFAVAPNVLRASPTSKLTCFIGLPAYYRSWAPNFAVYNPTQDRFVADDRLLSGNFDYDFVAGTGPVVNAIENSDSDGVTYVAGNFRTISGVRYNSIVARVKSTGTLKALRGGVLQLTNVYNYYDATPGTIKKIIRSNNNKYLFVWGTFNMAGDVVVNNLAIYNIEGQFWFNPESASALTFSSVNDMDYDGTYLYVVGSIQTAGKYAVKNAARYKVDENKWYPMNQGIDNTPGYAVVYSGKLVTYGLSASGASFETGTGGNVVGVWSSSSWKAVSFSSVSTGSCENKNKICTNTITPTTISVIKGTLFTVDAAGNVYAAGNSDLSYFTYYTTSSILAGAKVANFPKTNTVGVLNTAQAFFYEYNYDIKNLQHTTARDAYVLADAAVTTISAASVPTFAAVMVASIVAVLALIF